MALKGTTFGFYGTKSLRKNYNIGKKCIITIGFKVFSKNGKMAKKSILPFLLISVIWWCRFRQTLPFIEI